MVEPLSGAYVLAIYTINFVHAAYVPNNSNLRAHQPNLTDQFQCFSVSAFQRFPLTVLPFQLSAFSISAFPLAGLTGAVGDDDTAAG